MHFWSWMEHYFLREAFFNQPMQMDPTLTLILYHSVQFSSVTESCSTLCDPMDCSTPGSPVLHHLPELGHVHVQWVSNPIQPSCPLSSLLLLPSIFPRTRVFSNESALHIRWPQYWSFSFRSKIELLIFSPSANGNSVLPTVRAKNRGEFFLFR